MNEKQKIELILIINIIKILIKNSLKRKKQNNIKIHNP